MDLGEVSVGVRAPMDELGRDLAEGKRKVENFDRTVAQSQNRVTARLDQVEDSYRVKRQRRDEAERALNQTIRHGTALSEQHVRVLGGWSAVQDRIARKTAEQTEQQKKSNRETTQAERTLNRLTRAYAPLHHAAQRYEQDLRDIQRLQRSGRIDGGTADQLRTGALQTYRDRISEAGDATQAAGRRVGEGIQNIARNAVRGALVLGTLATAAIYAADRMLDSVSSIGLLARELDTSTDFVQQFRFAVTQMGGSAEEADGLLSSLTERVRQAYREGEEADDIFAALGVTLRDSNGNLRPISDLYRELADAIRSIEDPTRQAAVAQDVFGDSSGVLLNLLDEGAAGFNDLATEAERLGIILDEDLIDQADEAGRSLDTVKQIVNAEMARMISENAGAIVELAGAFADLAGFVIQATSKIAQFLQYAGRLGGVAGRMSERQFGSDTILGRIGVLANPFTSGRAVSITNEINRRHPLGGSTSGGSRPAAQPGSNMIWDAASGGLVGPDAPDPGAIDRALSGGGGARPSRRGGGRTRRGRDPAEEAARNLERFLDQMDQLAQRQISSEMAITTDAEQLAELERRRVERRFRASQRDIQNDDKLTEAQRTELMTALENIRLDEMELIDRRERERVARDALELQVAGLSNEADILSAQSNLATTARERRELELRILDLTTREERARLEAVIASEETTEVEKEIARQRLATLDQLRQFQVASIERANQSPGGKFLDDLTLSAEEAREAIEGVTVDGLRSLESGIMDVIDGTKSLGAAFRDVASSIISDLLRIAIQASIIQPIAGMLFGGGGKTGGPLGFLGDIFSHVGPSVAAGVGHQGMNVGSPKNMRNVPAMAFVGAPRFHEGLFAPDEFPAILQAGETVLPRGMSAGGTNVQIGDIIVQSARTQAEGRRTGKQVASAIQREISSASKTGVS